MRLEQSEPALVDPFRRLEPVLRQARRSDRADRGPPRMEPFGPGAGFQKYLDSRGRAARNALRSHELRLVQSVEPPDSQRRREMRDDPGGVKADVVESAIYRCTKTNAAFHPHDIGGEKILAGGVDAFGDAENGGKTGRGRMQQAGHVRVVEIETMDEHAIHQRGIAQR